MMTFRSVPAMRIRAPIISRRLRDALDIGKGKLVGDDCPPAIRAKLTLIRIKSHSLGRISGAALRRAEG